MDDFAGGKQWASLVRNGSDEIDFNFQCCESAPKR